MALVAPRSCDVDTVKRENWRAVLSGTFTKFLYYTSAHVYLKERERGGILL